MGEGVWRTRLTDAGRLLFGVGAVAALAFTFEITQSWVDSGISSGLLRWVLPSMVGAAVALVMLVIVLLFRAPADQGAKDATQALSSAIVAYAKELHAEGRDTALLSLRGSFSLTLHVLGFHDARRKVGLLSLDSATILDNRLAQAEILVDDVGWATYLLGDRSQALENITRGEDISRQARSANQAPLLDFIVCEAKALRHRALITCRDDWDSSMQLLTKGLNLLSEPEYEGSKMGRREIAQIHHARGMATAMILGVHKDGQLRQGDDDGMSLIADAIKEVREAAEAFNGLDDRARYTKALFLEVRLLEASGARLEAREVRAIRDRALASSEWSRAEGTATLTGV